MWVSLSRFFFEPSALSLPWAFCRNRMRQNRTLSGPENAAERLGDSPRLPSIPSVLLLIFRRQNRDPRQRPTKAPTPHFSPLEVYCRPAHRWVTNRLTGADTGLPIWGLRPGTRLMVIDREKNVGESLAHFRFSVLFENTDFLTGSFSLITAV